MKMVFITEKEFQGFLSGFMKEKCFVPSYLKEEDLPALATELSNKVNSIMSDRLAKKVMQITALSASFGGKKSKRLRKELRYMNRHAMEKAALERKGPMDKVMSMPWWDRFGIAVQTGAAIIFKTAK
jgi:hypothetical protein